MISKSSAIKIISPSRRKEWR